MGTAFLSLYKELNLANNGMSLEMDSSQSLQEDKLFHLSFDFILVSTSAEDSDGHWDF